jgi:hypothetical protein
MIIDEKVIIAILSASVGFLLSSVKDIISLRIEKKKAHKIALTYLLQLWMKMLRLEKRVKGIKAYHEAVFKIFPEIPKDTYDQILAKLSETYTDFTKLSENTPQDEMKILQETVNRIAIYDPILAFNIQSSSYNMDLFRFIHEKSFGLFPPSQTEQAQMAEKFLLFQVDAVAEFEADIRQTARKSGWRNYLKTRIILHRSKKQSSEISTDIEPKLKEWLNEAKAAYQR